MSSYSQNTMNVLIAADYRTPCSGNFAASILELAERMRVAGNTVVFLFPDNGKGGYTWSQWMERRGFSVHLMNMDLSRDEKVAVLERIVCTHNIGLIHSHFGFCHRILVTCRKRLHNVKVLFHDHMDYSAEYSLQKQQFHTLLRSAIYRLHGIGVVSVMEKKHKGYRFVSPKCNWYVPNGLSLLRNVTQQVTREQLRENLGFSDKDKICLVLGYNKYGKGLDVAIKAVALCREKDSTIHLAVIGVGCPPYESTVDWIQKMTGIATADCEWLHFLPSFEDIFTLQRSIDVFLSASRQEAFSYAVLEAISQNTPVVLSDVPGTKWACKYNKSFIYPVEDEKACADAIQRALNTGRIASNGGELVTQYSMDIWCNRMIEIYQKLLK